MGIGVCSFPSCGRTGKLVKNLCKSHYYQQHRGEPLRPLGQGLSQRSKRMTDAELAEWIIGNCKTLANGCMEWQGNRDQKGYGLLTRNGKSVRVHRFMLRFHKGMAPDGKPVSRHHCDNPRCVNPGHLDWGTLEENQADRRLRSTSDRSRKLSNDDVRTIRRRLSKGGCTNEGLAKEFGVSATAISNVRTGATYTVIV